MSGPIRVLIVDDHPLFRSGLKQAIEADGRFALTGETGNGRTALNLILETKPAIAVLDVNLPDLTGLEIAQQLQGKRTPTRLIILTMHKEAAIVDRALDSGVLGFVLKENAAEEILEAIVSVAKGKPYLSPAISGQLIHRHQRAEALTAEKPGLDALTKAERRILKLISGKKTSREIAAELFISPRTVEAHRANICAKLQLTGSHSLLQFALENRSAI